MFELCLNSPNTFTNKEIDDTIKKSGNEIDNKEYNFEELFNDYKIKYNNDINELENFKLLSCKLEKILKW